MIRYCRSCVMPDTKPDLSFNPDGICSACTAYQDRKEINWEVRKSEFISILEKYSKSKVSAWDCLIPVSGGKDSTVQVLKILELGFRPLCVTSTTCDLSEIGRRNIENLKNLGVDYVEISPDRVTRRKLNRIGLRTVGDIAWPEHVGIFTIPVRIAVSFKIPLIIWGENSQNEYGGPAAAAGKSTLDRRWLEEFGGLLGLRVSDMVGDESITENDLELYHYPTDDELESVGVTGLFLGHYFPWDGLSNAIVAQAFGFESYGRAVEGAMLDFENLDNFQHGIHDYFKFLKYGFGRASDHVAMQIRRGRITRSQGIEILKLREGKYPSSYLGKDLSAILNEIEMSESEFSILCDRFTNRSLFKTNQDGSLFKDQNGNLVKINYDNQ